RPARSYPSRGLRDDDCERSVCVNISLSGYDIDRVGYIDQGRRRMNEAVSEARLLRSQHFLVEVLTFAGWTERHCGSPRTVQQHAEEVVALSSEHGLPFWAELGTVLLGWSSAALGDARHGLDLIKKA